MFITFFSVIICGSNLIFGHRLQKGQSKFANPLRCPWSSPVEVTSDEGKDIKTNEDQFNSKWISRMYSEWATKHIITSPLYEGFEWFVICRQLIGCGHRSRSSTAGITSWSTITGCLLPKSELIFICFDVFPFIRCDFYRTWPWTTQRVCEFWLTLLKPMTTNNVLVVTYILEMLSL
jgi:hypothetical protein